MVTLTTGGVDADWHCPKAEVSSVSLFDDGEPRGRICLSRYCGGDKYRADRLSGSLTMRSVDIAHFKGKDGSSVDWPSGVSTIQQRFTVDLLVDDRIEIRNQSSGMTLATIRRIE